MKTYEGGFSISFVVKAETPKDAKRELVNQLSKVIESSGIWAFGGPYGVTEIMEQMEQIELPFHE